MDENNARHGYGFPVGGVDAAIDELVSGTDRLVVIITPRGYALTRDEPRGHTRLLGRAHLVMEWGDDGRLHVLKRTAAPPRVEAPAEKPDVPQVVLHIHVPHGSRCEVVGSVAVIEPIPDHVVDLTSGITAAARNQALKEAAMAVAAAIDPSASGVARDCSDLAIAAINKLKRA